MAEPIKDDLTEHKEFHRRYVAIGDDGDGNLEKVVRFEGGQYVANEEKDDWIARTLNANRYGWMSAVGWLKRSNYYSLSSIAYRLDEHQAQKMISYCKDRLEKIKEAGKVPLIVVADDCINHGWFEDTDEGLSKAYDLLESLVKKCRQKGDFETFEIRRERVNAAELSEYLGENQ